MDDALAQTPPVPGLRLSSLAHADEDRPPDRTRAWTLAFGAAVLVAGIAQRFWMQSLDGQGVQPDEAVTGLMALAAQRGEHSAFWWAQNYGGTLEVEVLAWIYRLFGVSTATLRLMPVLSGALAAVLAHRIGRRLGGPVCAMTAAALLWVTPPNYLSLSMQQMLFYSPTVVLGLGIFLMALRWVESPGRYAEPALLGLFAGTGWWLSTNILYFVVPVGLWLAPKWRRLLPHIPLVLAGVLCGALPWIVWNVQNDFGSLHIDARFKHGSYADHLIGFVKTLPTTIGTTRDGFDQGWPGLAYVYLEAAAATAFAVAAVLVWRAVRAGRPARPIDLLGITAYPLLYALNPMTGTNVIPRYLHFLWPLLALVLARLPRRILGAAALVTVVGVTSVVGYEQPEPGRPDTRPVREALRARGVRHGYADYGVAYQVTLAEEERITLASYTANRRPQYMAAADNDPRPAYIFRRGHWSVWTIRDAARASGVRLSQTHAGAFTVVFADGRLPLEYVNRFGKVRGWDVHW